MTIVLYEKTMQYTEFGEWNKLCKCMVGSEICEFSGVWAPTSS